MDASGNIKGDDCKPNEHLWKKKNNARMVCQVYTVPSKKAYISVKSVTSPGKPRMFVFFNVAGVVFKKKTDGGEGREYCSSTFPLLKHDRH